MFCDTNGQISPELITDVIIHLFDSTIEDGLFESLQNVELGLHLHNDVGSAVEGTIAGLKTGKINHIHGNLIATGERTGNLSFSQLWGRLYAHYEVDVLSALNWRKLRPITHTLAKILTGREVSHKAPFIGGDAFTHTAGMHTGAIKKSVDSYCEKPLHKGDSIQKKMDAQMRQALTPQAGKANISFFLEMFGIDADDTDSIIDCLNLIKDENGICFSDAWASF